MPRKELTQREKEALELRFGDAWEYYTPEQKYWQDEANKRAREERKPWSLIGWFGSWFGGY